MKSHLSLLVASVLFSTAIFPGELTKECNLHRGEDVLVKRGVEFVEPDSGGGHACLWNFSGLKSVDAGCRVTYYRDTLDLTHIIGMEQETGYDFYERGDTLLIGRYFNRTLKINYLIAEPVIKFPFAMGDTLTGVFKAKGFYSQRIPLKLSGSTVIAADGQGRLVTPDGDTLLQVVRVHTLRFCRLVMKDTLDILHDKYAWYAAGYRYPVFETIKTGYVGGDSSVTPHMGVSFYYSPQKQVKHLAADLANDSVWNVMQIILVAMGDSLRLANDKVTFGSSDSTGLGESSVVKGLRLYPIPAETTLTADFTLIQPTTVLIELYDRGFRRLMVIDLGTMPEGERREGMDVSGLPPGMYHIHFVFGGELVKMAFVKGG